MFLGLGIVGVGFGSSLGEPAWLSFGACKSDDRQCPLYASYLTALFKHRTFQVLCTCLAPGFDRYSWEPQGYMGEGSTWGVGNVLNPEAMPGNTRVDHVRAAQGAVLFVEPFPKR